MSLFSKFVQLFQDDEKEKCRPQINQFFNKNNETSESDSNEEEEDEDENEEESEEDQVEDAENEEEIEESDEQAVQDGNRQEEESNESVDSEEDCDSCKNKKINKVSNQVIQETYEEWYQELIDQRQQLQNQQEMKQQIQKITLQQILGDANLIVLHEQGRHLDVIDCIDSPQNQLDYINFCWDQITDYSVLIQHAQLLCKLTPDQVVNFIKSGKYPLNESLQLAKQYNIQEAVAILLESQNKVDQSIAKYLEYIDDILRRFLREVLRLPVQMNKKRKPHIVIETTKQLISTIQHLIKSTLQILDKNKKERDIDIIYFQVFQQIIDWQIILTQAFKLDQTKIEVLQIINYFRQITPMILIKLLHQTDVDLFIDELINNYSKLNLSYQFYCFKQIFDDFYSYIHILRLSNQEINNTNTMIKDILQYLNTRGKSIEIECAKCQKSFIEPIMHQVINISRKVEQVVIFKCGHSFHFNCQVNFTCPNCESDLISIINQGYQNVKQKINILKSINQNTQQQIGNEIFVQKVQTREDKMSLWLKYDSKLD